MLMLWLGYVALDPQPTNDVCSIAKWHPVLGHAEGARVHAKKQHCLSGPAVFTHVALVRFAGVFQGIVHVGNFGAVRNVGKQFALLLFDGEESVRNFVGGGITASHA